MLARFCPPFCESWPKDKESLPVRPVKFALICITLICITLLLDHSSDLHHSALHHSTTTLICITLLCTPLLCITQHSTTQHSTTTPVRHSYHATHSVTHTYMHTHTITQQFTTVLPDCASVAVWWRRVSTSVACTISMYTYAPMRRVSTSVA